MAEEEEKEQQQPVQDRVERALFSRLQYFKENENTITMASVRRLLEEDLGVETYALDEHKKFIKQFIEEHLYQDDGGTKNSEENHCKSSDSTVKEVRESPKKHEKDEDLKGPTPKDEPNMEEDSPIMGLLTTKVETETPQAIETNKSTIKKAIWERADHFRANSESLTLAGVRQILEGDLGLHKNALEPFKKFIKKEIEELLDTPTVSKSDTGRKKEGPPSSERKSGLKDRQNRGVERTAEPRGKTSQIGEDKKSNRLKRSSTEKEPNNSSKKSKTAKKLAEESSEAEANDGGVSEDGESQTSAEKPPKKKPISTPVHGKQVEHLKSIIKACGMSVPPSIYKKAKQVPDSKRESFLTKQLEDILSKEGLSSNPTEKDIKEVRKKKERAKELEGIDISNIVTSSRRRSTSSFMAPPTHKKQDNGGDNAKVTKKDNNVKKNDGNKDDKDGGKNEEEEKEKAEEEKEKAEEEKEEEEEDEDEDDEDEDDDDDSEDEDLNEDDNESD